MTLWYDLKQAAKPVVGSLLNSDRIRRYALIAAYLPKFHAWCAAHPCERFASRDLLFDAVLQATGVDAQLTYLEFGVFQGYSLRWWVEHAKHAGATFVGFDTFTGLPEDWTDDSPKGTYSTNGQPPDIPDPRCTFVVGLIQDTLPRYLRDHPVRHPLVVHFDADLYSAALFTLVTLAPIFRPGDILMLDEFGDYAHEFRAFDDTQNAYPINWEVLGQNDQFSPFWRVALRVR
ncbi:MAG TPA: class I SAM-dependent methyltransferase [Gemmatimonadales bacterium]|nr:class I SAM-dependent methyltransferase [Gemmatimonadales bacterium]